MVCAEWSVEVIEVLPFAQFGFEIGIAFVAEQLVELRNRPIATAAYAA